MSDGLITIRCPLCNEEIYADLTSGDGAFACPLCGGEFEFEDPAATKEFVPHAASAAPEPTKTPQAPNFRSQKRVSGVAVAITTLLFVGAGISILAFVASQAPVRDTGTTPDQSDWPIANRSGHTIDGVTVRVQSVQIGSVRAKNSNGTPFESDRQDYWTVKLRIHNGSKQPIEYHTWHAAEFSGAEPTAAVMKDDAGNRFVMQQFEDVSLVQGQTLKKILAPSESIHDVIVFEAPETVDKEKIVELRLELPGAACQAKGAFHQIIPKSLIEE